MKCTCSMMPSNIKIIKVGDSEVGIIDLRKILSEVYFLGMEDERALKDELLRMNKKPGFIMCICTGQCPGFKSLDLWELEELYVFRGEKNFLRMSG